MRAAEPFQTCHVQRDNDKSCEIQRTWEVLKKIIKNHQESSKIIKNHQKSSKNHQNQLNTIHPFFKAVHSQNLLLTQSGSIQKPGIQQGMESDVLHLSLKISENGPWKINDQHVHIYIYIHTYICI